jgi:hypothetical protein
MRTRPRVRATDGSLDSSFDSILAPGGATLASTV